MIEATKGTLGSGKTLFSLGPVSYEARYLFILIQHLRIAQRHGLDVANTQARCQVQAGFLISGAYCSGERGWGRSG